MNTRILLALAVALPLVVPSLACAAESKSARAAAKPTAQASFNRLDKNKDGFISRDEVGKRSALAKRFDKLDADHDGKLSRAEYAPGRKPRDGATTRKPARAMQPVG